MQYSDVEQNSKSGLSSDCRLKFAYTKSELLVMAGQNTAVNTFPGLVHTARHTMRVRNTRSLWANSLILRQQSKAELMIGVKS